MVARGRSGVFHGYGQGTRQLVELLVAFCLTALIGLEPVPVLDPSRVAAQIVSGIGFLGAGLIITRRGAVHALTTATAIWECAAIGMAAGAGLLLLAMAVTVLAVPAAPGDVAVAITISGMGVLRASRVLATVDGISAVNQLDDDIE